MYTIEYLISITEKIMNELNIEIRDTWTGFHGFNLDDYHINGKYGGERSIRIMVDKNTRYTNLKHGDSGKANGGYHIKPDYKNLAYNDSRILVPQRIKWNHAIIHELVHYLQANTTKEDSRYIYINNDMSNFIEYASQSCEAQAFLVQIYYIINYEIDALNEARITKNQINNVIAMMERVQKGEIEEIDLIRTSHNYKII